jgi:hypothetical protein
LPVVNAGGHQERRGWLFDRVFRPLTAAFDDGLPHQ